MTQLSAFNINQIHAFYELADIILINLDRQGLIADINPKGAALLGWSRHELIGKDWFETCLPQRDITTIRQVFNRYIDGDTEQNEYFQNVVITRESEEKTLSWHNMPWRNDRGDIVGTYSIGIDITRRIIAEEKEKALGSILEHSFSEILIADSHSLTLLHANASALKNLGFPLQQIKTMGLLDIVHGKDKEEIKHCIRSLKETEQDIIALDSFFVRQDGSTYPAEVHLQLNHYGKLLSVVAISRDVAARREAQRALLASELRYRAIFNAAAEAIITCELDGTITTLNYAAEKIFGFRAEQLVHENLKQLLPALMDQLNNDFVENSGSKESKDSIGARRGDDSQDEKNTLLESVGLHSDGTIIPVEISISTVAAEPLHFFMIIVRDLTESKRAEKQLISREEEMKQLREQLLHMDRLHIVNEMASGIAHEVNQPLTAISNYASVCLKLLGKPHIDAEKVKIAAGQINQQAQRAGEIIRMLRNFMKKHSSKYVRVDMVKLVDETIELYRNNFVRQDIQIRVQVKTRPLYVEADSIQIQQVLLNLLNNSIDVLTASEQPLKTISVVIGQISQQAVRVSIRDNGVGVPEAMREKLFEPFTTTKTNGLGLGLSICRSVITGHGGELQYNPDYKEGAEFYFDLPIVDLAINQDVSQVDEAIF